MKEGVVSRGYRAAQTGLVGFILMEIRNLLSEFEQIMGVSHRSRPCWFLDFGLLALCQEIEVGQNAPFFERSNLLDDRM